MRTEIYSFTQDHSVLLLLLYGFLAVFGIGMIGYGLLVMPNKPCEFDGRATKIKKLPLFFRIMMQGFPVLAGVACVTAGLISGIAAGKYYYGFYKGQVLVAEGAVRDVYVQTGEDGEGHICFSVDGEDFSLAYTAELAECFGNDEHMEVKYGFHKDEKLVFEVYTMP